MYALIYCLVMGTLFAPFFVTLAVLTGLHRLGERLMGEHEQHPRRDFIPVLPRLFNSEKLKSFAGSVSFAEPNLDQELIEWSLNYAEKIPEFKVCFPEVILKYFQFKRSLQKTVLC